MLSHLDYKYAVPALLMIFCCTLVPALRGARHAGHRTAPSAPWQKLLLVFVLAPVLFRMETSLGWYLDQHSPALVWSGNLLGFLGYWPVVYCSVRKWRGLDPVELSGV